jgi:hypothetical protein
MGEGQFTGNHSVHWSVVHHNNTPRPGAIRGRDPIAFEDIGKDSSRGLQPGNFRVRLRYGSFAEANAALTSASVQQDGDNYFLVFNVPAVYRDEDKVEPADPPSEVKVDW